LRLHVAIFLAVLVVTASLGVRERRVQKAMAAAAHVDVIDFGVRLHVVAKEPLTGDELIAGKPRMRLVRAVDLGGMVEVKDGAAQYTGPSENPRHWFASEQQAALILHEDTLPLWLLIEGSEGAGKSTLLAMWHWVRVAEHVGERVEGGLTAPTYARLGHVKKAIAELWDPRWYVWKERDLAYTFHVGPRVQLVSAVKRSEAGGSPIQGANWSWHGGDELQDHFEREADIEARGRSAKGGRYKRLNTATVKDSSDWRTFKESARTSPLWSLVKMLGRESPFIPDAHWDNLETGGTMSKREIDRRIYARDVGPERQVYHCWARTVRNGRPGNLRRIPDGAIDVTAEALKQWSPAGRRHTLLVGHDPGKRQHVSVFLKAYRLPGQPPSDTRPRWFVVDEVTSPDATVHSHVLAVLDRARSRWKVNLLRQDHLTGLKSPDLDSPQMLVRIDPHTRSGTDHPGQDVYTRWRAASIDAKPAAYRPGTIVPATIKKESRLDMMNTLLCATDGTEDGLRRLFVAVGEDGKMAAPSFVKAVESMERNEAGEAEADAKDADDMSHWPAAVGYALWMIEAPRLKLTEAAA
jgi:hypothetical protein